MTRHLQITGMECLHKESGSQTVGMCCTSHVCLLRHPAGPVTNRCEGHAAPRCSLRTE